MPPKKAAKDEGPDETMMKARFGRVKNTLRMGLVGLPNVGKSSLFNLLTKQQVAAENFPFCTIDPNEAKCPVPDQRFNFLCDLWRPPSKIPAFLSVTDIAGLIKGASEGAGLGNAFLSHIAAVDGIFHVVRAFSSDEVVHVDDSIDPVRDLETIVNELCLKDLEIAAKNYADIESEIRKKKSLSRSAAVVIPDPLPAVHAKIMAALAENKPVGLLDWTDGEVAAIRENYHLITTKPIIYMINLSKKDFCRKKNKWLPAIGEWVKSHGGGLCIPFSIEFEEELYALKDDAAAQEAFCAAAKVEFCNSEGPDIKSVLPRTIKQGFKALNLINFLTAGDKEVRAWTLYGGSLAPQAAGVIHTDFQKGFIKAEIAAFDDFKALCNGKPSMAPVKDAGKYRQEGKTYVMADGDIVEFQFNVSSSGKKK